MVRVMNSIYTSLFSTRIEHETQYLQINPGRCKTWMLYRGIAFVPFSEEEVLKQRTPRLKSPVEEKKRSDSQKRKRPFVRSKEHMKRRGEHIWASSESRNPRHIALLATQYLARLRSLNDAHMLIHQLGEGANELRPNAPVL